MAIDEAVQTYFQDFSGVIGLFQGVRFFIAPTIEEACFYALAQNEYGLFNECQNISHNAFGTFSQREDFFLIRQAEKDLGSLVSRGLDAENLMLEALPPEKEARLAALEKEYWQQNAERKRVLERLQQNQEGRGENIDVLTSRWLEAKKLMPKKLLPGKKAHLAALEREYRQQEVEIEQLRRKWLVWAKDEKLDKLRAEQKRVGSTLAYTLREEERDVYSALLDNLNQEQMEVHSEFYRLLVHVEQQRYGQRVRQIWEERFRHSQPYRLLHFGARLNHNGYGYPRVTDCFFSLLGREETTKKFMETDPSLLREIVQSLIEMARYASFIRRTLDEHFRCHPSIRDPDNKFFTPEQLEEAKNSSPFYTLPIRTYYIEDLAENGGK